MRRLLLLIGAGGLLMGLWLGPLRAVAPGPFSAHMIMHMGVVAAAAPMIALGVAGTRFDPAGRIPQWFAPIPASIAELAVVWAWHAPALHHWARHQAAGLALEQGMFLSAGIWVWLSAFGGGPELRQSRRGAGILGLLLTSMHMTLLGALLALAPRPLYSHGVGDGAMAALDDQHLGGAIMLLAGGIAYLFGGLGLAAALLRDPRRSRARAA